MSWLSWIARTLPAGIATAAVLLRGSGTPANFWNQPTGELVFLLSVGVLVLERLLNPFLRRRRELAAELERQVTDALKAALVSIVDATTLDWKDIGVSAFLVRRWPRFWKPHLHRIARFRVSSTPPPSGINWTKGKGVIGLCWKDQKDSGANLYKDWRRHYAATEAQWNRVSSKLRQGLSYPEFKRANKYGAVVATPIRDRNEHLIGCVSADAPGAAFRQLWKRRVRELLQDAAQTIASLAGPHAK